MILRDRDGYFWEFNDEYDIWISSERDELVGLCDCPDGFWKGFDFVVSAFGPCEVLKVIHQCTWNEETNSVEYSDNHLG